MDAAEQLALITHGERYDMSFLQESHLRGLIALTHARRGDVGRAEQVLAVMGEIGTPKHFDASYYAIPYHIARARVALERFEAGLARQHLDLVAPHWRTMELWPLALEIRATIDWHTSGPHMALLTLREGRAEKRSNPPIGSAMSAMLNALEAELVLAADSASEAAALLTPSRVRRSPRLVVPRSRALLLAGRWEQAANLADRHSQRRSLPWSHRVDLMLISASANLRAGDRESAQERFDRAVEIASLTKTRTAFSTMPRTDFLTLSDGHPELVDQITPIPPLYPTPGDDVALSRRELRVLAELAGDATLTEIAGTLSVSTNTLKSQLRSVYRKLGASSRREAVQIGRRRGLLFVAEDEGDLLGGRRP